MIALDKVGYDYGGAPLLTDVSFDLPQGSFSFLTGPSGAGKTTLLKLCYGALPAMAGDVAVLNTPIAPLDRDGLALLRRRIGVVHQDCTFVDHLSISENIALPLTVAGRDVAVQDLLDLLAWVGLRKQADQLPPSLSGGERQRAALARAVIAGPDVVIADEPTGNVDWEMSQRLLALLVELNKLGKTIVIATHDLHLIRMAKAQVAARVLRLKDGQLTQAQADL